MSEKGKSEKGLFGKGNSEKGFFGKGKSEKGLFGKGKSEKGLSEKGKSEKGLSEKGKSEKGYGASGFPIKAMPTTKSSLPPKAAATPSPLKGGMKGNVGQEVKGVTVFKGEQKKAHGGHAGKSQAVPITAPFTGKGVTQKGNDAAAKGVSGMSAEVPQGKGEKGKSEKGEGKTSEPTDSKGSETKGKRDIGPEATGAEPGSGNVTPPPKKRKTEHASSSDSDIVELGGSCGTFSWSIVHFR